MNYASIKTCDIANGLGVRVSLFVSGCTHHCKECFNEMAWDFNYGHEFTKDIEDKIIVALSPSHIAGLTLLGGEPMEIVNQRGLLPFLKRVKAKYPDKNIWCYTGYLLEDLLEGGKVHCEVSDELLSYIDILVDGPFVLEQKNIRLKFRGSENQRIIMLKETLQSHRIILWNEE